MAAPRLDLGAFSPVENRAGGVQHFSNFRDGRFVNFPKEHAIRHRGLHSSPGALVDPLSECLGARSTGELSFGQEVPGIYIPQETVPIVLLHHTHISPARDGPGFFVGRSRLYRVEPLVDADRAECRPQPNVPPERDPVEGRRIRMAFVAIGNHSRPTAFLVGMTRMAYPPSSPAYEKVAEANSSQPRIGESKSVEPKPNDLTLVNPTFRNFPLMR